jgi:hypothetical protein
VKPSITNAAELPAGQEFVAIKVEGETYQSVVCTAQFAFFSPEVCVCVGCTFALSGLRLLAGVLTAMRVVSYL